VGTAFFSASISARADDPLALAHDLLAEGDWAAAAREARRVEIAAPNPTARVVRLVAEWHARPAEADPAAFSALRRDPALGPAHQSLAALYLGVLHLRAGRDREAADPLRQVLLGPSEGHLLPRAVGALLALESRDEDAFAAWPGFLAQVRASAGLCPPELRAEVEAWIRPPTEAVPPAPARWLLCFYRSQISPAIGQRCAMIPSCSEYYRQASRRHGLVLGTAMVADRFYREPDHARLRLKPVPVDGKEKYEDPVSDHDFWRKPARP
jgi:putative component of membrane protein insertase Oxa1/YidC/SpoIIIJ protein YidD